MIVGIDLGTTNSLVAVWKDGGPRLVPNALGSFLTPSCVGIDADGHVLVGEAARERLQTHPGLSAALFKRYMGSARLMRLGDRDFRPEELSALVLRALKDDAEAFLGEPVTEAIITVPAYFSDAQRKATRVAGELAGLKVERLLNEPTAAALAYGMHEGQRETQFLVFDLGGGTFDVSILEMFEGVMEVRASAGDNMLGGEDFATLIADLAFARGIREAARMDAGFMQRLAARAESAKRELGMHGKASFEIQWQDQHANVELDANAFEKMAEPLLNRLWRPIERALRDARIRAADLDNVVLAGGATRMPMIRALATRMFGRFPAVGLNPDEVVALGAAVQAGLKMKDKALDETVMTDVCPYTLGTEVVRALEKGQMAEGYYAPIIERNTVVPVSKVERFYPAHAQQREILIRVYQGESRMVRDNIRLGEIKIPIEPGPAHANGVDVRFTYDVNGLLEVEVRVVATGEARRLVVESGQAHMSPQEIARRLDALSALKIHPRDTLENRTLLARAERLYEQLLGSAREFVGQMISRFEQVLATQDPRLIARDAIQFRDALKAIEADSHFAPDRGE
ncbi:Hsp70 family protein [Luteibacter aegosomatissinici]|uniref:Hsp70 family protein n=1 Tax=Luteibacter aegosomatissinici TaxID=2911539 RepID=UPI001FF805C6|nr:molecular chaperone HscC [Luteibacter aegosomatissinici]UPG95020.1 Hsp70 family protein [Luteibacter aegosomatissinici]